MTEKLGEGMIITEGEMDITEGEVVINEGARARKDKYLIPNLQLRVPIGVLIDLLPNLLALVCVIPVEVEGNEGLHAVAGGGVVGVAIVYVEIDAARLLARRCTLTAYP